MNNLLLTVKAAIAARDEVSPAFVDTAPGGFPGIAIRQAYIIKALSVALGNYPLAWEAATEAVLNGPARLAGTHEIDVYLAAALDEANYRLRRMTA